MAMCSKVLYLVMDSSWLYFYLLEISRPVPPPRPDDREVWENVWLVESAAGVALFSGLIQVSVEARISGDRWLAYAVMKSALFTANWQFHSPTDKGVSQSEVCFRERRLLRLRCRLVV